MQSGSVQFVHDGTTNPPSYSVSASDGRMTSTTQAATISFDVPPTLTANTLTINQGQTLPISSSNLSASDPYTSSFTFTITSIQHGYFALASAPSTPITSFTQAQVAAGNVQFVHDGSANPPSYSVSVSDGRMTSTTQAATISFDVPPTLTANTLTINQGQTLTLSAGNLNANDPYMSSFTFTVSVVQHGYFALTSAPTTPITSFTQAQVQSAVVQFVHDGSSNPPSYSVSVSDGRMSSTIQSATISFDVPPTLVTNTLTVNQGQTVILSGSNLSASDPYTSSFTFTVSLVQYGYFALTSAPTTPVTSFTQAQIQSGSVQFVQDGSTNVPSYSVSVSDGRMSSAVQAATVSFDETPVLTSNSLTINQGQTVVLSSSNLSATDPYAPSFTFTLSNVQHGYFSLTSAPTTSITSFTQAQLQSGSVQFVHDGSINPPSYNVLVSDGRIASTAQAATISFDIPPSLVNNALTINQGQTVVLSSSNLSASDPYTSSFTFTISLVQHGYFSLTSAPTIPITSFTQAQLQSGIIQFVQDGTANPPSYSVSVSDGRMTSTTQPVTISFDVPPTLVTNTLTINQGQTLILGSDNLSASDPYATTFTYTVSNVQHGFFALTGAPTTSITSFTQAQLQSGSVQFVHDGSVNPPSYSVVVSDGRLSSIAQMSTISFDATPILENNNLTVDQGDAVILTASNLSATNPYNISAILTFAASNVQYGYFSLTSTPTTHISSFTQAQVQNGKVQFVQDGSIHVPDYSISVSDGRASSLSQASSITFNPAPVITTNGLTIIQGHTVVLSTSNLDATGSGNPGSFVFTVSNVQHGQFELVSNPGAAITTFTQAQIQNGEVQFVADGSTQSPSYSISVGGGGAVSEAQVSTVIFNLDATPVLVNNLLSIQQGQTIVLNSNDLSATDVDEPADSLLFTVSLVQNGYFALVNDPKNPITSFTQAQIQSGLIEFVSDGGPLAPSYSVSVSDPYTSTSPVQAAVTFTPTSSETSSNNTVRNSIIGGVVSGVVGLAFLIIKLYLTRRATKSLQEAIEGGESDTQKRQTTYQKEVIQPIASKVFDRIKTTGFLGYRSDEDTKNYVSAIETIVGKLSDLGVDLDFSKMSLIQQGKLLNEIAKQLRKQVVAEKSLCSMATIYGFFKPEVTPQQIEEKAGTIAEAVQKEMRGGTSSAPHSSSESEVELADVKILTP